MTNVYEMMFILRPDLSGDQVNKQLHKYRNLLKDNGAGKVSMDAWGKKRLAYEIQKFQDGIYVLTHYTGDGTQVAKIEKDMRYSEDVLRYLTIKLESDFEFEEKAIPEVQSVSVEPKEEISAPELKETTPPEITPSTEEKSATEESNETEATEEVAVEA